MKNALNLRDKRKQYVRDVIHIENCNDSPFDMFYDWFQLAEQEMGEMEAHAMILSTVNDIGVPSARVVLLKHCNADGFVFFTNYNSKKGKEIEMNNNVSLLFFWPMLEQQIRVEGKAIKVSEEDSTAYFDSRPELSRIAAVSSPQSETLAHKEELIQAFEKNKAQFNQGGSITRPMYWGGYNVIPTYFEFWQGGENRLHDRAAYTNIDGSWSLERLAP